MGFHIRLKNPNQKTPTLRDTKILKKEPKKTKINKIQKQIKSQLKSTMRQSGKREGITPKWEIDNSRSREKKKPNSFRARSAMIKEEVDSEDIAEWFTRWTGIPVKKMAQSEKGETSISRGRIYKRGVGTEGRHPRNR